VSRKYKAEDENIANPYGQGDSSKQVIEMIKGLDFDPCKSFYDVNIEPDLNKKVE
jgi:UDP-N-acetylglucosamine 2-epimerase (non-hydrolysing)